MVSLQVDIPGRDVQRLHFSPQRQSRPGQGGGSEGIDRRGINLCLTSLSLAVCRWSYSLPLTDTSSCPNLLCLNLTPRPVRRESSLTRSRSLGNTGQLSLSPLFPHWCVCVCDCLLQSDLHCHIHGPLHWRRNAFEKIFQIWRKSQLLFFFSLLLIIAVLV